MTDEQGRVFPPGDGSGSSDQPTQHGGPGGYAYGGAGYWDATQLGPQASVPPTIYASVPPVSPAPGTIAASALPPMYAQMPATAPQRSPRGLQPQHWAVLTICAVAVIAIVVVTSILLNQAPSSQQRTTTADTESTFSTSPTSVDTGTTPSPPAGPNLAGMWTGEYRNTGRTSVQLTVTDPERLDGTIEYLGQSPCTESWRETGRSGVSVYVDEVRISGDPDDCWSAKWELTINGDTITGTMVQPGQGFGATIVLHKHT